MKPNFLFYLLGLMTLTALFGLSPACAQSTAQTQYQSQTSPVTHLAFWKHNKNTPSTNPTEDAKPVHVTIETTKGTMHAVLYTKDAPITTKNFIDLAQSGFYDGLKFHRVEPGFVIQTGDPTGTGTGGSDKTIPLEISPNLSHDSAGVLGMARTDDPNSASSQFYITLGSAHFLDKKYAVFGKLTDGEDVAEKIQVGDKVTKITVDQPVSEQSSAPAHS